MKTMTGGANGRPPRKQLGDQIDRLDAILDGLAEALNGAVAEAAAAATRAAVREVLAELLLSPEVLAVLKAAANPNPAPMQPQLTVAARLCRAATAVTSSVRSATTAVVRAARSAATCAAGAIASLARRVVGCVAAVRRTVSGVAHVVSAARRTRRLVAVALGVGAAASVVAGLDHRAATALSGVGAGLTAAAVQVGLWLRRGLHAATA